MKAFLMLADGTVFEGEALGANGTRVGEVVFHTGMAGYQELLTDPVCCGQIVTGAYPLAGNYGVNDIYAESGRVWAAGYAVREICDAPSNFRCKGTLGDYLAEQGVVSITGIDTRSLVRVLREKGTMNGAVTSEYKSREALLADTALMEKIRAFRLENAVETVTCKERRVVNEEGTVKVALLDLGCRKSVIDALAARGCRVTVLPAGTSAEEIGAMNPDGIVVSDGPGAPEANPAVIAEIKKLAELKKPVFGFGLGHELIALAMGAKTEKLLCGHRGANQPVLDLKGGRTYITAQNHSYAVVSGSEKDADAEVQYINANDKTVAGLVYHAFPCFTVQFYPVFYGSSADESAVYDRFVSMMKGDC